MITSRDPRELLEPVRSLALALKEKCADIGITIIFTSTYRDVESQNALYAQGRTTSGNIVTKVKGGDSFHNWRVAFDVVPVVGGKAIWDDNKLWAKIGKIGTEMGLDWGGSWKSFVDKPHFQYTGGLSISDFKSGKTL